LLKIVTVPNGSGTAVLVLEGRLIGPWVDELRRACEEAAPSNQRLTLDLRAVSFVDRGGLDLLRSLTGRRARLNNCSLFVAEQLRTLEG
jgi:ABC-type transporter Mla MlaB component